MGYMDIAMGYMDIAMGYMDIAMGYMEIDLKGVLGGGAPYAMGYMATPMEPPARGS